MPNSHTYSHTDSTAIRSNLEDSFLSKETTKCRQEELGIEPLTFWLVDIPLCLLSCPKLPTNNVILTVGSVSWENAHVCCFGKQLQIIFFGLENLLEISHVHHVRLQTSYYSLQLYPMELNWWHAAGWGSFGALEVARCPKLGDWDPQFVDKAQTTCLR